MDRINPRAEPGHPDNRPTTATEPLNRIQRPPRRHHRLAAAIAATVVLLGCAPTEPQSAQPTPTTTPNCQPASTTVLQNIASGARRGDPSLTPLDGVTITRDDGAQLVAMRFILSTHPDQPQIGVWLVTRPNIHSLDAAARTATAWPTTATDPSLVTRVQACATNRISARPGHRPCTAPCHRRPSVGTTYAPPGERWAGHRADGIWIPITWHSPLTKLVPSRTHFGSP